MRPAYARSSLVVICVMLLAFVSVHAQTPAPLRVDPRNGVPVPKRIKSVDPVIPPGIIPQGETWVELLVSPSGKVQTAMLLRAARPAQPPLDKAVMEALKQYEYEPTIIGGIAYPITVRVAFNFRRWLARRAGTPQ